MEEPTIFCPGCGNKSIVLEWYEYAPRRALGYAKCGRCGTLDFKILNGRILTTLQADPGENMSSTEEQIYGLTGYEPEIREDLKEVNPA